MRKLTKWVPFMALMATIAGSSLFLFFGGGNGYYKPATDDPAVIYRQACMECHGKRGEGNGVLYPAFDKYMDEEDVLREIREGNWRMPAFRYIRGDTLLILARYIADHGYLMHKE